MAVKNENKATPKKSGFDAPVYGRRIKPDEKLVKQPNGKFKIVKK